MLEEVGQPGLVLLEEERELARSGWDRLASSSLTCSSWILLMILTLRVLQVLTLLLSEMLLP